jgi:hypothetical protein
MTGGRAERIKAMDVIQQSESPDKLCAENFPRVKVRRQRARRKFNAVTIAIEVPVGAFDRIEGIGDLIKQALAGHHLRHGESAGTRSHSPDTAIALRARATVEKFVAAKCICDSDRVEKHHDLYAAYLREVDQERQADAAMDKLLAKTETSTYKLSSARSQTSG